MSKPTPKHFTDAQRYQLTRVVWALRRLWDEASMAEHILGRPVDTTSNALITLCSTLIGDVEADQLQDQELIDAFHLTEYQAETGATLVVLQLTDKQQRLLRAVVHAQDALHNARLAAQAALDWPMHRGEYKDIADEVEALHHLLVQLSDNHHIPVPQLIDELKDHMLIPAFHLRKYKPRS